MDVQEPLARNDGKEGGARETFSLLISYRGDKWYR